MPLLALAPACSDDATDAGNDEVGDAGTTDSSDTADTNTEASDTAGSMYGAYVTWNLSEFNRLRLQVTQMNPEEDPSNWTVALQWDAILGSHQHPLDF